MSWRIDGRKAAIIIVDVQEQLVSAVAGAETILAKIDRLLDIGKRLAIPVHFTELAPDRLGPISSRLLWRPGDNEPRFARNSISAGSVLPKDLPQFLLVVGMETHAAIRQTVYDFREGGHAIYVAADAVGSRNPADHQIALDEMRQDRIVVTSMEALLCELAAETAEPYLDRLLSASS
ncbi:nicotinamidase/pyrazinamidase [Methylacidimicrobium cyclopophantes]|uniref:Nicotinamidase/pyrazinamidase n=1 Tax=Methylacidimicrobium cyclopophantes TaxID=1041766 RepID=A0A5E6MH40_9BACT|nr:isochorismatase family protein [Methylacidimicrobium cyclopophantes]VVM07527.1 nicotinamidase/pyrazinamidase [Methylacidimicrobium cyclopophantes]